MCTVSLCMIVKNEEAVLARCLDSVKDLVDEIVIVDTGSTDATRAIASRYTDKVYNFTWIDDFSAARNASFSHAEMDYCLWLDADDLLLPPDREGFRALKATLGADVDVVMMRYHTAFDDAGTPTFSYYRERLVRNHPHWRWEGAIHEAIVPHGKVIWSEVAVTHRKEGPGDRDRNLRIFEGLLSKGAVLSPRERFYYGRELYYHGRYEKAAAVLSAFWESGQGWVENRIDSCMVLSRCLRALGREEEALEALLRAMTCGVPRAELCCDIGQWWLDRGDWRCAAFWYQLALDAPRDDRSGAFVLPDCHGYIPALQLCVCWYHLGERDKAAAFNDLAEQFKPNSPQCRYNRSFFAAQGDAAH